MGTSPFYRTMSQKTDAELKAIVKDKEGYLPEARTIAESILRERKIDILLEDEAVPKNNPSNEYDEPNERLFYINWQAPTIVILIGFGLYFLLGLSFYFNMSEEVVVKVNGRVIFRYVVVLIIYFAFAVLIDGIIKGKVWARATYMGLAGLGIFWKFIVFILNPFIIFPPLLDIALILIEVALIVLLFVQPASQWFVKKKKKKIARQDILDDL